MFLFSEYTKAIDELLNATKQVNDQLKEGCYESHIKQRIEMLIELLCHRMIPTCDAKAKYE